jgi:putative flippase GtrA
MQPTFLLRRLDRPLRFGVVGASGIVVNSAILWVFVRELHLAVTLGSLIATEAAILSNFLLNDRWTFRDANERSLGGRLLRFNGVALGGVAITAGVLTALTSYTHLHLLIANLLAVGAATFWNYAVNSRWTWRQGTGDGRQGMGDRGQGNRVRERWDEISSPAHLLTPSPTHPLTDGSSSAVGRPSSVAAEEVIA